MSVRNVAERPGPGPDVAQAKPTPERPASPITVAYLERAALHYLERYSASTEMLRRTLRRRVEKRARARGEADETFSPETFAPMIEEVVARAVRSGLVDDARFTAARLATLRRRGSSARAVSAKLAAKGVSREAIETAMEAEREAAPEGEADAIEAQAARAYAKRRRLGPFRRPGTRAANRDRDLAAMARAGFPYGLARATIEAEEETDET